MGESKANQIGRPTRIIGLAVITTVCVVAAAASLVYATEIFLVLFLAVLFGVFLSRVSQWLTGTTPLNYGWSLGIVTTTLITLFVGGVLLFGVQVEDQIAEALTHVDEAETMIDELASQHPAVGSIISSTPFLHQVLEDQTERSSLNTDVPNEFVFGSPNGQHDRQTSAVELAKASSQADSNAGRKEASTNDDVNSDDKNSETDSEQAMASVEQDAIKDSTKKAASIIGGVFKTTFGLLVNSALIFFVGLFIAAAPGSYRDGIVSLLPPKRRQRATEVMNLMGDSMWHWLIGRFGSMLITGVGAGILLAMLGVPMATSIGIVTALLTFIPNIGGLIALMLAVLFALPLGGTTVGLVIGGYAILQLIESYVATPLIQQKQVSIPPALLIAFQAVLGVLFGFLGAAVASPMLAAAKVGVEEAYIKDFLESEPATDQAGSDAVVRENHQFEGREQAFSQEEEEPTLIA